MLFIDNSYTKDFESKIIRIENNQLILENTAFYAKSGGQPGDTGELLIQNEIIKIIETCYNDKKEIIHLTENKINFKVGEFAKGTIDWEKRYKYMRMHTALHLLCSLIPYQVTGGQIALEKSRLDFNSEEKFVKEDLENKINILIEQDHKIEYQWITGEELDQKPELVKTMSVKPPRTNNKIRLVKIGNIDLQPCGGTHVKSTKEIGKIFIGKIENKGKMNKRINLSIND